MIRGSLRSLLLSSATTAALVASAGMAHAVEYKFGDVEMHIDTTVSAGASMNTAQTDHALLPTSNGGPLQVTTGNINLPLAPTDASPTGGTGLTLLLAPATISGSINTDDGRLNFNQWDLTSGVVKMTNDVSASFQNYKFFGRVSSYYDAVLASSGSYNRYSLKDGKADAARDIKLLDFYGSADYDVGGMPLNIRAGKQVISWGEGTFIQNGINTFNPIDVSAVRRPASELKEFFIPVWAADASIGLPYNLSLEAFYQLKWDTYALDRGGTPFASSDIAAVSGNYNNFSWLTGGPGGNIMRNCTGTNSVSNAFTSAWAGSADPYAQYRDCSGAFPLDYRNYNNGIAGLGGWPVGNTEALRAAVGDGSVVSRDEDRRAKNSGQFGLAARWYSEDLNNTEFGFYFTNTHSRLPIASERVRINPANATFTSYLAAGINSSASGRAAAMSGCNALYDPDGPANPTLSGASVQPGALYGVPLGTAVGGPVTLAAVQAMNQAGSDPNGILAAATVLADNYYANIGTYTTVTSPGGAVSPIFGAGVVGADISTFFGQAPGTIVVQQNSALQAAIVNCALVALQSNRALGNSLLTDGSEIVTMTTADPALGVFLEYPENIRMFGASFNTTVGTWGVQGEFSFRPNAPMQLDTDQLTIAALDSTCIFEQILGLNTMQGINGGDTLHQTCGSGGLGAQSRDLHGYVRSKMWTAQVGTTATYSNSNSIVEASGADLGILVTEVGLVYAPNAPHSPQAFYPSSVSPQNQDTSVRWANVCTGGTDLPLAGFLSLASRAGCRATNASWGYVLLGQLQYNNAFGTALTLSPTLAFSHDVSGNTPAPYSNYRQGRKSVSLQLNGSFQSAWKGGISYTNYLGADKYNDAVDRDNVALNISYAF